MASLMLKTFKRIQEYLRSRARLKKMIGKGFKFTTFHEIHGKELSDRTLS
jgi:hypothetical protein